MADDLSDAFREIRELKREVRRLQNGRMLENASVTEGRLRFVGGTLLIDSGGVLSVVGTAKVQGRLEGSGAFDWTGPMNLKGAQSITGPTTFTGQMIVNGPWKMVGNGEITGNVDLKGSLNLLKDLLVKAGGRIVVEGADQIVLEQSGGVARIGMGASEIRGGDGIGLYSNAGPDIISTAAGLRIAGLPTISGVASNTYIDAQGFVRRIV